MTAPPLRHLIVGAGLTGLLTARAFQEAGLPYAVYEKTGAVGGVWNADNEEVGLVNEDSTVQTDPVTYGFADEAAEVTMHADPFVSYHQTPGQLMTRFTKYARELTIPIVFHREVVAYRMLEGGEVLVKSRDVERNEIVEEPFAGLHLRTGSLAKRFAVNHRFPGEADFKGTIAWPFAESVTLEELQDKRVVVIGWGSFAMDTIKRALKAGAQHVTVLTKRHKFHLFDFPTYLYFSQMYSPKVTDPDYLTALYRDVLAANRRLCDATGVTEAFMSPEVIRTIRGEEHVVLRQCIPTYSADPVALGMYYGLVDVHVEVVGRFEADGVVCQSGRIVTCDVAVKCFGFESEAAQTILKGHLVSDCLWVDGLPNVTTGGGADKHRSTMVMGPKSPGCSIFLLTAYSFFLLDKYIIRFLQHPEKFEAFAQFPVASTVTDAESPHYPDMLGVFNKVVAFQDPEMLQMLMQDLAAKERAFQEHFDRQRVLRMDRKKWNELCAVFSRQTGKPPLPYPLDGLIQDGN